MVKLKSIHLKNFGGYRDSYFEFIDLEASTLIQPVIKPMAMFFGPNGVGKTTILEAINMIASPQRYENRDNSMLFRKHAFHTDYHASYGCFRLGRDKMEVEAVFATDEGDKRVKMSYDPSIVNPADCTVKEGFEINGVDLNELPKGRSEYACYVDADNPINMQKFQCRADAAEMFLDIAEAVYGYKCELGSECEEYDDSTNEYFSLYADFIIHKPDENNLEGEPLRIHFKNMSDGEKKIATMLAHLTDPPTLKEYDIFLIDNIELHIYFARHHLLIDKLKQHFPTKQIIATTHSSVLVGLKDESRGLNLPSYVEPKYLYNIVDYRKGYR